WPPARASPSASGSTSGRTRCCSAAAASSNAGPVTCPTRSPQMSEGLPPPRDPIDEIDRRLINSLQGDFPLAHRPYGVVAERLGLSEEEVIRRLRRLLADRVLTRF